MNCIYSFSRTQFNKNSTISYVIAIMTFYFRTFYFILEALFAGLNEII